MWGRDRERGGDKAHGAKQILQVRDIESAVIESRIGDTGRCLLYPPPCPSPTLGGGNAVAPLCPLASQHSRMCLTMRAALARKRGAREKSEIVALDSRFRGNERNTWHDLKVSLVGPTPSGRARCRQSRRDSALPISPSHPCRRSQSRDRRSGHRSDRTETAQATPRCLRPRARRAGSG